jgi:hypothetical protein
MTLLMRILKNIVHIQQKTRNMSVKLDNLKVSTLNQLNSVNQKSPMVLKDFQVQQVQPVNKV